ncbi:hypothetical protein CVT24_006165 [Panaeolus cyanescens]|uniref:Ams2/SPT21 N-terminal domain-containing protein n=1 Tax=Panaeolus cyanescens TaxID=181874 RepID=A0A409VCQ7_9AGAR|nr:hypothetical protein CVT24_006165 [Panaeolus cyanescens]
MVERKSFLRVLYTINSSPQYILARSHGTVTITTIQPLHEHHQSPSSSLQPLYATVSLKSCLETICRSSPELTQDTTRDFSLYVLDPLESNSAPAPVHIANGTADSLARNGAAAQEQPRGVAVGLGLMSWAMSEQEPVSVVGTLVKQNTGVEALEVIFALRETVAMRKPVDIEPGGRHAPSVKQEDTATTSIPNKLAASQLLVNSMTSQSSFADYSSSSRVSLHRPKTKSKPPRSGRPSSTPVTESDKLMNADTYIGPLKKKGRPRATIGANKASTATSSAPSSSSRQEIIIIDGSDSDNGAPSGKSWATTSQSTASCPGTQPLVDTSKSASGQVQQTNEPPVQVKVEPQESGLMELLANLTHLPEQQAAILNVLRSLAGNNHEAMISGIKHLIEQSSKLAQTTVPQAPPQALNQPTTEPHSAHAVEVVVDKENVNPVQRKPTDGKTLQDSKVLASSAPTTQSSPDRPIRSLGISSRSNENLAINSVTKQPSTSSQRPVRKRTLSDFMDEKESGRGKGKGKERERGGDKRDSGRAQQQTRPQTSKILGNSLRHYPRLANFNQPRSEQPSNYYRTPLECLTSPVRQHTEAITASDAGPSRVSFQTPAPPPTISKPSASSPVRGTNAANRKRYKVPEWARTNTATQPRLSEEAQRALQAAEEQKHQLRLAARRKSMNIQAKTKKAPLSAPSSELSNNVFSDMELPPPPSSQPAAPPIACSNGPVFPGTSIAFPILGSSRSSSPPPSSNIIPKTPKTPTRPRHMPRATPGQEDDSLFTPIGRSGSLFGSVHAPSPHASMSSIITSPLDNRKKVRVSLYSPMLSGKGSAAVSAWSSSVASSTSETSQKTETNDTSKDDLVNQLEEALLEEDDCPPSSLPIASSDMDITEVAAPETTTNEDVDVDLESAQPSPVKQHWPGLPPSSPPPPSSPVLLPDIDLLDEPNDEDMEDLPIATSDSEMEGFDTDGTASPLDQPSPEQHQAVNQLSPENQDNDLPSPADSQDTTSTTDEGTQDMQSFSNMSFWSDSFGHPTSSELFEQYTNVNAQSDDQQFLVTDTEQQAFIQSAAALFPEGLSGLESLDFTELWSSVLNPIIQQSTNSTVQEQSPECDQDSTPDNTGHSYNNIDHLKIAEEMQNLLGGCVM